MHHPVINLLHKGGVVVYTTAQATVADAVEKMAFHNVGSTLVLDTHMDLVGIFTERDLARRVVLKGLNPKTTFISQVMTDDIIVVFPETPRGEVQRLMKQHHIRHIPIVDRGKILGVVSLRDVLRHENMEKDTEIETLKSYVMNQAYPC